MSRMATGEAHKEDCLPGEFGVAVECCKSSFRGAADPVSADMKAIDWSRLLRIVRFHRIEGLAWKYMAQADGEIPEQVSRALSHDASAIAASNLRAAAECRDLSAAFNSAGLALLFLKGLPLGALAYETASLKSSIDVDLLIDPAELERVSVLLLSRGYRLANPRDPSKLHLWHRRSKESLWVREGLQVDLHTRTADNSRLIRWIDVHSPRQIVDLGSGIQLATLADEQLFTYLAVHGASSAWFRLKWIADVAGFLNGRGADELEHLYRRSQELGAGRAAGQALLLADRLFGTLSSVRAIRDELRSDTSTRRLYEAALRLLISGAGEPTERLFGTLPIHWTQFLLLPGSAYKLSELARQARRAMLRG